MKNPQEEVKVKKSKALAADGNLKKKEKSKAGKYSKVPPPKQQVEQPTQEEDEQEPMEGMYMWNYIDVCCSFNCSMGMYQHSINFDPIKWQNGIFFLT